MFDDEMVSIRMSSSTLYKTQTAKKYILIKMNLINFLIISILITVTLSRLNNYNKSLRVDDVLNEISENFNFN